MSRIDERLEIMGVDTSEMTDEEKFTAATGLTRYDADMAADDWYVPAGAGNTPSEASTGETEPQEETPVVETPTGEQGGTGTTNVETPTGEPSTAEVESGETGVTGETTDEEPSGDN